MAGYFRMWQIAASAADIPVVVAAASEHKPVVHSGKKPHRKNGHKAKPHAVKPTPPAPN